jgi:predicted MFS family arabinose efflux permease
MGSAAVIGLIVLGIILFRPRSFEVLDRSGSGSPAAASAASAASGRMAAAAPSAAQAGRSMMGLPSWLSPSVLLCFLFFVAVTLASTGLQNFAPQALQVIYGISASTATGALTLYLIAGACGMFAGGFAAAASNRHERIAMACLIGCSLLLFGLASGIAPSFMILPVLALAGFFLGILQPSRDMLVRKAAPVKSSGRAPTWRRFSHSRPTCCGHASSPCCATSCASIVPRRPRR